MPATYRNEVSGTVVDYFLDEKVSISILKTQEGIVFKNRLIYRPRPRTTQFISFLKRNSGIFARAFLLLAVLAATTVLFSANGGAQTNFAENTSEAGLTASYISAEYRSAFRTGSSDSQESSGPSLQMAGSFFDRQSAVIAKAITSTGDNSTASGGPDGIITYHAQSGDTLGSIAEKFDISLNTVLWANDNVSQNSTLQVGQELTILPVSGVAHKVKPGETLGGIALTYDVSLEKIAEVNDVSQEGFIVDGQVLIIPGGEPPAPAPTRYADSGSASVNSGSYFADPVRDGSITQGAHAFNAVDLGKVCGANIYASAGGAVSTADAVGWNGGYGKFVKISHPNGTATLYAHMSQILVRPGQNVGQGALIGRMGTTGRSTGCHLHFEVRGASNPFLY